MGFEARALRTAGEVAVGKWVSELAKTAGMTETGDHEDEKGEER